MRVVAHSLTPPDVSSSSFLALLCRRRRWVDTCLLVVAASLPRTPTDCTLLLALSLRVATYLWKKTASSSLPPSTDLRAGGTQPRPRTFQKGQVPLAPLALGDLDGHLVVGDDLAGDDVVVSTPAPLVPSLVLSIRVRR